MSFLRKLLSLLDCFQDFHENIIILSKPIPSCATYRRTIKAIGLKKVKAYEKIFLETWDFPQNIYLRWTLFLWLNCNRFSRTFLTFSKKSKNEKHPEYFSILHIKASRTTKEFEENLLATLYIFICLFLLDKVTVIL